MGNSVVVLFAKTGRPMKGASLEEKVISFEYENEGCLPETSLDQLEVLTEAVDRLRLRLERRIWVSPVCRWYLDQRKARGGGER